MATEMTKEGLALAAMASGVGDAVAALRRASEQAAAIMASGQVETPVEQPGEPTGGGEPTTETPTETPGETGGGGSETPGGGEPGTAEPSEPNTPDPGPVTTPPVIGAFDAFGPAELQSKVKAAKGGEAITARKGYAYDGLAFGGVNPQADVTITAEAGVRFGQIVPLSNTSKLAFRDLNFELSKAPVKTKATPHFIASYANTSGISVIDCSFRSRSDADAYPDWTLSDWQTWMMGAVLLAGPDGLIDGCTATAVNMGYSVGGVRSAIRNSKVYGASRDAARLTADFCAFENNYVQDMIFLNDGNHPDMLQLFEAGNGYLEGLVIRGNTLLCDVGIKNNPLAAGAQGIGGYGSPASGGGSIQTTFGDIVVENNVVDASAFHGMALCIVQNGIVRGNKLTGIVRQRPTDVPHLWVYGKCANTIVENNQATKLKISAACIQSGNTVI